MHWQTDTKEKNNSAKSEHRGATSYHYYELNRTPAELDYHTGLRPEDIPNIYEDPEQKLVKGTEIDDYSNSYFPKQEVKKCNYQIYII